MYVIAVRNFASTAQRHDSDQIDFQRETTVRESSKNNDRWADRRRSGAASPRSLFFFFFSCEVLPSPLWIELYVLPSGQPRVAAAFTISISEGWPAPRGGVGGYSIEHGMGDYAIYHPTFEKSLYAK